MDTSTNLIPEFWPVLPISFKKSEIDFNLKKK
jgi:hypothetical protein